MTFWVACRTPVILSSVCPHLDASAIGVNSGAVNLLLSLLHLRRWRRPSRWLRALLAGLVLLGMMPGAAELVEVVAHVLHDGHLPHGETHEACAALEDHGSLCCDRLGCTPLQHHCDDCPSLAATPFQGPPRVAPLSWPLDEGALLVGAQRDGSQWAAGPLLRPPIG